jgi:hypothetical protein
LDETNGRIQQTKAQSNRHQDAGNSSSSSEKRSCFFCNKKDIKEGLQQSKSSMQGKNAYQNSGASETAEEDHHNDIFAHLYSNDQQVHSKENSLRFHIRFNCSGTPIAALVNMGSTCSSIRKTGANRLQLKMIEAHR